ncbi:MAG: DNA mismatch repair protein MutS [Blastocatellia bacterium]|nr:DNA mismatch repair protein MutS [Blastocatellia bacterium]
MVDTKNEYAGRLAARQAARAAEEARSRAIWNGRRLVFAIILLLLVASFEWPGLLWLLPVPVIVFVALMAIHQRVHRRRERLDRAVRFYERGLGRLNGEWMGSGEAGERFADKLHPYAEDLDLFGSGSVFELLCNARTRAGEETLAAWLKAPAAPAEIRARQAAVEELRGKLDLREDLALLGADVRSGVHAEELAVWGAAPPVFAGGAVPAMAIGIAAFASVAIVLWLGYGLRWVALLALMVEAIFLFRYRDPIMRVITEVERPGRDLALLAEILALIEQERFASPKLVELRRRLDAAGAPPSRQIAQLHRLIEILDSTRNQFFAPIAFILLIHAHLAYRIDRWRRLSGSAVRDWLAAIGEIEALGSLAGYAYEHPYDPFPEIHEDDACFEGRELGHPFLSETRCIRNDVRLGGPLRVLIVSGSNMSGKSTLMRTVGVNAVLALAGAPVRARSLRLSPLTIGASIHILDSLQTGASRFYAEITRLQQIVQLTREPLPLLFLLDEILSGTNSHDRRIGAEAVVKGLVERGALGIVTTHDLALTQIEASLGERAANVHFEDHLEDGRMVFDYKMQPGIVTRSNALALMRAVGLDV